MLFSQRIDIAARNNFSVSKDFDRVNLRFRNMKRSGGFPANSDDMIPYLYGTEVVKSKQKVKALDYFRIIEPDRTIPVPPGKSQLIRGACRVCNKLISGSERVNSNFISHLRKNHPETYMDFEIKSGRIHRTVAKAAEKVRSNVGGGPSQSHNSTLSIASLDENTHGVVPTFPPMPGSAGYMHSEMVPRPPAYRSSESKSHMTSSGDASRQSDIAPHMSPRVVLSAASRSSVPTSTVIDYSSSHDTDCEVVSPKSEPPDAPETLVSVTGELSRRWSADTRKPEIQGTSSKAVTEALTDLIVGK